MNTADDNKKMKKMGDALVQALNIYSAVMLAGIMLGKVSGCMKNGR